VAESLLDALRARVIVGDGAMGTRIYERGIPLGQSYDALNLTQPDLIRSIHREYVAAGAELIETNTFCANRVRLRAHGLEERVREVNRRGAELAREAAGGAFVAGSVGPLRAGVPQEAPDLSELPPLVEEQIAGLLDGGVDALILETFISIEDLLATLSVARRMTKIPIIAQMTFLEENRSLAGDDVASFVRVMEAAGPDVIGVNCGIGPHWIVRAIQEVAARTQAPISAFSNAGRPHYVDGRFVYLTTPDYFARTAERLRDLGVSLIGGCCGTTPEMIQAAAEAVKGTKPGVRPSPAATPAAAVAAPAARRKAPLQFWSKLERGRKPIVVELDPPRGLAAGPIVRRAIRLTEAGVDAITVGDNPLAVMRMGNMGFAHLLEREGVQTIVHLSCRDKNLIGLQSQLLEAAALGVRAILALTGDPARVGDQPRASSVYDLNSFELIKLIGRMNQGQSYIGRSIQKRTDFRIGAAFNPNVKEVGRQVRRLAKKIEAGAEFSLPQPLYDRERIRPTYAELRAGVGSFPVFFGICPFVTARHAEFLANEVPGIVVPPELIRRVAALPEERQREEGVRIALELVDEAYDVAPGFYIIPAFGSVEATLRIVEHLRAKARAPA
jgi:homocysteine S-methyltransferase